MARGRTVFLKLLFFSNVNNALATWDVAATTGGSNENSKGIAEDGAGGAFVAGYRSS